MNANIFIASRSIVNKNLWSKVDNLITKPNINLTQSQTGKMSTEQMRFKLVCSMVETNYAKVWNDD